MCCCAEPNINGQPGYQWQPNDKPMVRTPNPPALAEGDALLYDEPGRCGGLDCHSHHFRLVDTGLGGIYLLVRHGGGDERIKLCCSFDCMVGRARRANTNHLQSLDSNGRYWLFHTIYSAHRDAERAARERANATWQQAAAQKRIKTRKMRGSSSVKVWIEPEEGRSAPYILAGK
jgi:hypothetical protein